MVDMVKENETAPKGRTAANDSPKKEKDSKTERHSMRMYPDDFNTLVYWSQRYDMDRTEFLVTAMQHYIRWRNGDFDLPNAEMQRLNQLTDVVQNLASSQVNLQHSVVNGFDAMLGIIRGDNYLVEDDDGEL